MHENMPYAQLIIWCLVCNGSDASTYPLSLRDYRRYKAIVCSKSRGEEPIEEKDFSQPVLQNS
jgi:hypothetical protein